MTMAVHYRPTDYLYISARLRAKEAGLVGKERLARLAELPSADEVEQTLVSEGCLAAMPDTEQALCALLRSEFEIVRTAVPDPTIIAFLQYPYDCHNIKSALKCHYRGISPEGLWLDAGTVPVTALSTLPGEIPAQLPQHMRAATEAARVAFEQSGDPRELDFILDAACFADMRESAAQLPFALELVRVRADLANLCICKRLLSMYEGGVGELAMAHAYLPGGGIEKESLLALVREGREAFSAFVAKSRYHAVFEADSAAEIERRADNFYVGEARRAAAVPFGAEVAVGYLVGVEYAVKNLRILLAAKRTGTDAATLGGRLRDSYV